LGGPLGSYVGISGSILRKGRNSLGISREELIEGLAREKKNRLSRARLKSDIGQPRSSGTISSGGERREGGLSYYLHPFKEWDKFD
jgi:hypothetical protein